MTSLFATFRIGVSCRALRLGSILACMAASVSALAQNSISVLPPVYVRSSTTGTTASKPDTFSTGVVSLTCPSWPSAVLSSNSTGTGNVLVDNSMFLDVVHGTSGSVGPVDLCHFGGPPTPSCFNLNYEENYRSYIGQDPDTFAASGGVAPIDISSYLKEGANQVTLNLLDYGAVLGSTTLNLYTNCSSAGTGSGAKISGNPIPSTNIPANLLTQDFTFSGTTNNLVQSVLDFSVAEQQQTLTVQNQTIPIVSDVAIPLADWPSYVAGTPFATSECLVHNGEIQSPNASGIQCPTSTERNIVIQDVFDGPNFYIPDIVVDGVAYHQGFGFIEAKEGWTGGPCAFDPGSEQIFSCPENLLTLFTGPGTTKGSGTPNGHFNSTFISVGPVPEYLTSIALPYCSHQKWVNTRDVQASFKTRPPVVPPPNNGFVAAPVYSITYGVSPKNELPSPEFPVPGDVSLYSPAGCTGSAKSFQPAPVTISVDADGLYLIHYFATDCAGTEELRFPKNQSGSWTTTFFVAELDVDTVKPKVISGPTLSPAPTMIHGVLGYAKGEHVTATYQCSDELSGVEQCGYKSYSNPIPDPGSVATAVDTATIGTHTFIVGVKDAAQNVGTPATVSYQVVDAW
jgi:hypothetical protein